MRRAGQHCAVVRFSEAERGGFLAERIFWVKCPGCAGRFYCDFTLRFDVAKLICPYCQRQFFPSESPEIDDRPVHV